MASGAILKVRDLAFRSFWLPAVPQGLKRLAKRSRHAGGARETALSEQPVADLFDWRMQMLRRTPSDDVILVFIGDETVTALGKFFGSSVYSG